MYSIKEVETVTVPLNIEKPENYKEPTREEVRAFYLHCKKIMGDDFGRLPLPLFLTEDPEFVQDEPDKIKDIYQDAAYIQSLAKATTIEEKREALRAHIEKKKKRKHK